jgi:hypothetical protein
MAEFQKYTLLLQSLYLYGLIAQDIYESVICHKSEMVPESAMEPR